MAIVRFLSPEAPNLRLPGVPAQFVDGVYDLDDTDTAALGRMRYLGAPYGVTEVGRPTRENPWLTESELLQKIADPNSAIYQALAAKFVTRS